MKKFIVFFALITLLIAVPSFGQIITVVKKKACNYTGCSAGCKLFDWDCSTTSMASNVCSVGADTSASLTGEANVTGGNIAITDDTSDGGDRYIFGITAWDIMPAGDVTIEMTINVASHSSTLTLFMGSIDANNYRRISLSTTGDVTIDHKGNSTGGTVVFDTNLGEATPYTLIIKLSTTLGMSVKVNSEDATYRCDKHYNYGWDRIKCDRFYNWQLLCQRCHYDNR